MDNTFFCLKSAGEMAEGELTWRCVGRRLFPSPVNNVIYEQSANPEWKMLPAGWAGEEGGEAPVTLTDDAPELMAGYKRYTRRGMETGGHIWCGSTGRWRKEAMQDLRRQEASCFFRAMAWVLTKADYARFYMHALSTHEGLQAGVTPQDAFMTVIGLSLPICLAYVAANGRIRFAHCPAVSVVRGLLWVPLNDAHQWAPHWLPWTSIDERNQLRWTFEDLDAMAPGGVPRAEVPAPMHAGLIAARLAAVPARAPVPDYAQDTPVHPPVAAGYVCWNTPPVTEQEVQRQNDVRARVDAKTKYFAPKLWCHNTEVNVSGCELRKGEKPTAVSRAKAHCLPEALGFGKGLMWELHPRVLIGAEISEGDFVFYQSDSPVSPVDPRHNVLGQYLPDRLSAIVTSGNTLWSITDEQTYQLRGKEYTVYRLVMTVASNFVDLVLSSFHIKTTKITSVRFNALEEVSPAVDSFPTPQAYLRACYDQLAKLVNPELVGTLMMCRNEELARDEPSGLLPQSVAADLERLHRELQRMWRAPGYSVLPFMCQLLA